MDAQRIAIDAVVALTDATATRSLLSSQVLSRWREGSQAPAFKGLQRWRRLDGLATPRNL